MPALATTSVSVVNVNPLVRASGTIAAATTATVGTTVGEMIDAKTAHAMTGGNVATAAATTAGTSPAVTTASGATVAATMTRLPDATPVLLAATMTGPLAATSLPPLPPPPPLLLRPHLAHA